MAGKQIVWTGNGTIEIGSAGAPVDFWVGFDRAAPTAGDFWVGPVDDSLSTNGNWFDGSSPTAADSPIFANVDDGGTNIVNTDLTVASLYYTGAGSHTTRVNSGYTLAVTDSVGLYVENADNEVSLTISGNLTVTAFLDDFNIGWNSTNGGEVKGVFDASDDSVTINLDADELNIGRNSGNGTSSGIFKWDQTEAILANGIIVGRGSGATASVDVPAGGTLRLGTAGDRVGALTVAYDDTNAGGTLNAELDFDIAGVDPTFEAYLTHLTIG